MPFHPQTVSEATLSDAPPPTELPAPSDVATEEALTWLERTLPRIMRRLLDSEDLNMPLLQLPMAQMRLAHALYQEPEEAGAPLTGEPMGRLSDKLGVRQNALTQAADRLISHALAERVGDPNDRRVVRLRLTAQGREWVAARRARRRARLDQLWTLLEPPEREAFLQAVRTLEAAGNRLDTNITFETKGDPQQWHP